MMGVLLRREKDTGMYVHRKEGYWLAKKRMHETPSLLTP
jgi:hypothetical protein